MTSYLVTIATDSHQPSVKMCLRDIRRATGKRQVEMIIRLGKIPGKTHGGGVVVRPTLKTDHRSDL